MNAPFRHIGPTVGQVRLDQPDEVARIEAFVAANGGSVFHRPAWLTAIAEGTGNEPLGLLATEGAAIRGWLPLHLIHCPIFGRMLASSGFAVGGGILASDARAARALHLAAEDLAIARSCPTIELRGGMTPDGWDAISGKHSGFASDLADDDEAQLLSIPRKQRAEVRKGLANDLEVRIGKGEQDRASHYSVYAESVRNLGTPVFPRALFDAVLDCLDADILTVLHEGAPVASVLSLYHDGAVLPYWGGGTPSARFLRANDVMYYRLMLHAGKRGCSRFDFGRSKTGSGPYNFKRNWGFEPQPLTYSRWNQPGTPQRDADPTSAGNSLLSALWQKLPLPVANRLGPMISRGLG
ncbi:FemAB family XrtA/PEP-CTERM system-associated protein [Altererythrobacter sp. CAU 1778]